MQDLLATERGGTSHHVGTDFDASSEIARTEGERHTALASERQATDNGDLLDEFISALISTPAEGVGRCSTPHTVRLLQTYSKHCVATKMLMDVRVQAESEHRAPGVERPILGSARQLRPSEVDLLVERYKATQNIKLVADELGLYRATVREHLKRRNIPVRKMASMNALEIAEAVRLYEAGDSSVTVGEKLGFSNHTILKGLRARGTTIRPQVGR
jgi:hypothetical protein